MKLQLAAISLFASMVAQAQVVTSNTLTAAMSTTASQSSPIAAGSASTLLSFTADPSANGGDIFDVVVTDPTVVISLILPGGTEITAANGPSLGFQVTNYQVGDAGHLASTFIGRYGNHVQFQLPAGQQAGVYSVRANATAATSDAAMAVLYTGTSSVRLGIAPDASFYRAGDTAVISGILFDGNSPIAGATLQATVWREYPVVSGVSFGNYVLVSQTTIDANTVQYNYTVDLTNSGSALSHVIATAASAGTGAIVTGASVAFGDLGSGSTTTSGNFFSIQMSPSTSFDPSMLNWTVLADDSIAAVSLIDGGPLDAAIGDGIYTGTIVLPNPGTYKLFLTASGTSLSGLAFVRTAAASMQVTPILATFVSGSVSDSPVGTPIEQVVVSATANVQVAGTYNFSVDLVGSTGLVAQHTSTLSLASGSQQVSVFFQAQDLLRLGSGPYERTYVRLVQVSSTGNILAAQLTDAGPTAAYSLSSFDRGPLYLTGQNSAAGIDTTGSGSFDLLAVQIGVYTSVGGSCEWSGTLGTLSGALLDYEFASGTLNAGTNTITLNFNGNLIAQSGLNGPYILSGVGVTCGGNQIRSSGTVLQTGMFSASQFHLVAQSITVALIPPMLSLNAGTGGGLTSLMSSSGGFGGVATLSITGLPSAVTIGFTPDNQVSIAGTTGVSLFVPTSVSPGTYPFTLSAVSGSLSATTSGTLTVTIPDFAVAVSPASLSVAPSSQVNTTVTITPANTFNATVALSISGLPTGAVPSFLPASVSGGGPSTSTLNIVTNGTAAGSYPFTITGTSGTLTHSIAATLVVSTTALPYPWVTQGIGANSSGGSATHNSGEFSVTGPGNSLSSTSDSFQFVYQPLSGNGTLIGRIEQTQNATGIAMAGVVIRETLDPGASNVFLGLSAGATATLQSRTGAGNPYTSSALGTLSAPYWFELVRVGNTFTAYTSPDGINWTQQGSVLTVAMASSVFAGLALSSDANGPAATAVFDHALVAAGTDFYLSDAQPSVRTAAPNNTSVTFATTVEALSSFSGTVTLAALGLPTGATASFSASSITGSGGSLLTVNAGPVAVGTYPLFISATSGSNVRFTPLTLVVSGTSVTGPQDPWGSLDIGSGASGTGTAFSNGVYTVSGSGQSIASTVDGFRFEYQSLVGDGTILARVVSVQNERPASRFGPMMRESLDPSGPYAAMLISNNSGDQLNLLGRSAAAGIPVSETGASVTEPYWLKLVRAGNTFTGFASPDGINWTQIGTTRTIVMSSVVFVGLAVCSGDPAQVTVVNFDTVTVSSGADFYLFATPTVRTIPVGSALYYHTVKMLAVSGSFGSANLTVSGLPTGISATLSASSLSPGNFANLQLSVTNSVAAGTYPITITGVAGSLSRSVVINLTVTAAGSILPNPWTADDIGQASVPGTSTLSPGAAMIQASGADLNTTSDSFRYTYQAMTGDGTMIIRNYNWLTIWDGASNGVMIRESLLPDAAYAYARIRADVIVGTLIDEYGGFQYRPAEGAATTSNEVSVGVVPYWFKVVRSGSVFSGYISPDGLNWTQVGASVTINMPPTVFIGLAVCSGNNAGLTTAYLDSETLAIGPDFGVTNLTSTQTLPLGRGVGYYSQAITSFNGFSSSISLSTSGLPAGASAIFTSATITGAGTSILQVVTGPGVTSGTYPFQIVGVAGSLSHSAAATLVVDGAQSSLPAPWNYDFIGTGIPSGTFSATLSNGVYTLNSSVCCVSGTADQTFFAHQTLSGDGTIVGRLTGISGSAPTQTGLMIRNTLDPASPGVMVLPPGGINGSSFTVSMRSGSGSTWTTIATVPGFVNTPGTFNWLKIAKQGSQVTIFASPDSTQWLRLTPPISANLSTNTEVGMFGSGTITFDNVSVVGAPDLLVSAFPPSVYSMNGVSASINLSTSPSAGPITAVPTYSITGMPSGVTAQFTASPVTGSFSANSQGIANEVLTIAADSTAVQGTYPLTVTVTSGSVVGSTVVTLNVEPGFNISNFQPFEQSATWISSGLYGPTLTPGSSRDYTWDVTYVGGFSSGVCFQFGADFGTYNVVGQPNGNGSTPCVTGTYTAVLASDDFPNSQNGAAETNGFHWGRVTAFGAGINTTQYFMTELGPDFVVGCCLSIAAGTTATAPIYISRYDNHTDPVTLAISGFPTGLSLSVSPNPVNHIASPDTTTLTETAAASVPPGWAYGTVTASSASVTHAIASSVLVLGFTFSTSQPSGSVIAGGHTTITGTLAYGLGGYPSAVTFGSATLPTGVTVTFSPTSRTTAGTTTITITTSASTPAGTYTLNFNGTGNNLVNSAPPVTLVVTSDFGIAASSLSSVNAASSTTSTITISTLGGFSGAVALAISGLPTGATAAFNPTSVAGGSGTSTLTVTTTAATPAGSSTLVVTGTSGSLTHSANLTLSVKNYSLSVNPTSQTTPAGTVTSAYVVTLTMGNGYNSSVTFGTTGLPTGATANFSTTSRTSSGTTNLTVTPSGTVGAGSYPFTITGTGPGGTLVQSTSATLVVTADFSISVSPSTVTVTAAGSGVGDTITVNSLGGYSTPVALTVSGLPTGATGTFNTSPVTPGGTSTLTLGAASTVAGGNYTITVTGTVGSVTHTQNLTLIVKNFSLSASPTSLPVSAGSSGTSAVTLTMAGGYNSTVTFGTSGLPTGASATFSPTTRTSTGTTTVTVATTGSVASGSYPFTITGTNGSLVQSTPATLVVSAGFSLTNSGNKTIVAASNGTVTVTVTATSDLTGATGLAVSGLPTNATAIFNPTSVTGSGTSTITITVPATVAGGASTLTITGTNGSLTRTTTLTLTVQNFTLSASPSSLTVTHGGSNVTSAVTLTMTGGFSSSVTFTATALPSGVTATFSPTSRSNSGATTLTIHATSAATLGGSTINVVGTSGSLVQSIPISLTVN